MSTINCSNCNITLSIPPGAKSICCSVCQAITQVGFAAFGLTPSTPFNFVPPQSGFSQQQAPPSQNFGLTPSKSFNYVPPQSGFSQQQAPPSQNFGLTPSKSFNYVPPQSGFGSMQHSGSFNRHQHQQQQQPVFPSLTQSHSFSHGVPGRKKAASFDY